MIGREITKKHETFYRGTVEQINMFKKSLKGELTVVISKKIIKDETINNEEILKQAKVFLKKYSLKDVAELISKKEKIAKKRVYKICLSLKK